MFFDLLGTSTWIKKKYSYYFITAYSFKGHPDDTQEK